MSTSTTSRRSFGDARFQYDITDPRAREHGDRCAGHALHDDPLLNFALPDHVKQARWLLRFMQANIADTQPFGEVWVPRHEGSDAVSGAAVWLPPDAYPHGAHAVTSRSSHAYPPVRPPGSAPRLPAVLRLLRRIDRAPAPAAVVPHGARCGPALPAHRARAVRCSNRCSRAATPKGCPPTSKRRSRRTFPTTARSGSISCRSLDVRGCPPCARYRAATRREVTATARPRRPSATRATSAHRRSRP